ncbi:DUF87 domain-containing protein [bacterium]|nr:DUF87 domain-containing protein [bacterium]
MFPIEISVQDFMSTHSLIIGQTRSGKSHLTRLLIEQTHGKCSQFVFDREGEYVTLRERFDFVVIGEGWDFKASPAIAAELAVRLLRLGASAIIDLSSMKHKDDLEFVRGFVDGLMSLKLDEQREAMLVFDEVHLLAPEGKETACGNEIMNIAKRGLKRGMFAVFTTQRLPEVAKGVVLQSNNYFSGRVVDIDAARTAGRLRLNKSQVNMLQSLHRGEFFVAGPAIQGADNALLVTINDTITHAPNRRNWKDFRLAPAKGAVLAALGELKDVEQEVKEKAQTIEQLRTRIRELEQRPNVDTAEMTRLRTENAELHLDLRKANLWIERLIEGMRNARSDLQEFISEYESGGPEDEQESLSVVSSGNLDVAGVKKFTSAVASGVGKKRERINGVHLPTAAERMLAYAASRYPHSVTRGAMVAYARISSKSSNVGKFLKLLTEGGYLELKAYGYAATELGCKILPDHEPLPDDPDSKLQAWKKRLAPGAVRMLDAIHKHRKLDRERVLDIADVSPTSSNAGKFFKQLQEYGLIVIEDGYCQMHKDYR